MASNTITALRQDLNRDGCAYGQVSRERLTHVAELAQSVEQKLTYVLVAVGLQLVGFFIAVVLLVLNRMAVR